MSEQTNDFVIFWNKYGLEYIEDITGKRQRYTMSLLAGNIPPDAPNINAMEWRARFNPDREYELYALKCSPDITQEYIEQMFDENPQEIVNLIRSHGIRFFGKSMEPDVKQVIV